MLHCWASTSQCFKECTIFNLKDPVDPEETTHCNILVNYTNVKTSTLTNCNALKDIFLFHEYSRRAKPQQITLHLMLRYVM